MRTEIGVLFILLVGTAIPLLGVWGMVRLWLREANPALAARRGRASATEGPGDRRGRLLERGFCALCHARLVSSATTSDDVVCDLEATIRSDMAAIAAWCEEPTPEALQRLYLESA